jgi:hypothetical protein
MGGFARSRAIERENAISADTKNTLCTHHRYYENEGINRCVANNLPIESRRDINCLLSTKAKFVQCTYVL